MMKIQRVKEKLLFMISNVKKFMQQWSLNIKFNK